MTRENATVYQILNGDSLAQGFPVAQTGGEIIVVREALIDGSLDGTGLGEFWQTRAGYVGISSDEYRTRVASEFEKILRAPPGSEFNLWFEYDLFCQVNMWFVLSLIASLPSPKQVWAVYPSFLSWKHPHFWSGFGAATAGELLKSFRDRIPLNKNEIQLGQRLWQAYKNSNLEELTKLSAYKSASLPYLQPVVQAHTDRFPQEGAKGRPESILEEIIRTGPGDFQSVFVAFSKREPIYGFGDNQLKAIYDRVRKDVK